MASQAPPQNLGQSLITKLHRVPLSVGGAAVYAYTKHLIEACKREAKYPDEDGNTEYNLCRVVGTDEHPRIWVPRNMAGSIPIDNRTVGLDFKFSSSFKPRDAEQARWVKECVRILQSNAEEGFVARAPTGFGKTWATTDVIAQYGKKTIVVVNKDDIVDQWVEALDKCLGLKLGKGIGMIRADKCDVTGHGVVIAMIQSISKPDRYPSHAFQGFGFAVWDETHRVGADFFSQSCYAIPARKRMGVSATPKRKDDRDEVIHAHIGPTKVWSDSLPMIPRVIVEESPWKCPMQRKTDKSGKLVLDKAGEIEMVPIAHTAGRTGHIENMMMKHHGRNKLFVDFMLQCHKKGRKILFQSTRKEHLDIVALLLAHAGVHPSKITKYVGGLTKKQRDEAKLGSILLSTFQMTKEATDIPDIDTLVLGMPISDVEQAVGRCTRFVEGKDPVVFDIVDGTSPVFDGYAEQRRKFYRRIGAKVTVVKN